MRLWHFVRADRVAAMRDGVLYPMGYPDIAHCEAIALRGPDGNAPVSLENLCTPTSCKFWDRFAHDRTPVTWLMSRNPHPGWPMIRRGPLHGEKAAALFCLDLDPGQAVEWAPWALSRGAMPDWVEAHQTVWRTGGTFITTQPIPRTRWVSAYDCSTGLPLLGWRTRYGV